MVHDAVCRTARRTPACAKGGGALSLLCAAPCRKKAWALRFRTSCGRGETRDAAETRFLDAGAAFMIWITLAEVGAYLRTEVRSRVGLDEGTGA